MKIILVAGNFFTCIYKMFSEFILPIEYVLHAITTNNTESYFRNR